MIYLYAASHWLDLMDKTYGAFVTVFVIGWVTGLLGYWLLARTPHPAIREAEKAREEGKEKVIAMNWSGHGLMDMTGYEAYFDGKMTDYALPEDVLQKSLGSMAGLPKPPELPKRTRRKTADAAPAGPTA